MGQLQCRPRGMEGLVGIGIGMLGILEHGVAEDLEMLRIQANLVAHAARRKIR